MKMTIYDIGYLWILCNHLGKSGARAHLAYRWIMHHEYDRIGFALFNSAFCGCEGHLKPQQLTIIDLFIIFLHITCRRREQPSSCAGESYPPKHKRIVLDKLYIFGKATTHLGRRTPPIVVIAS